MLKILNIPEIEFLHQFIQRFGIKTNQRTLSNTWNRRWWYVRFWRHVRGSLSAHTQKTSWMLLTNKSFITALQNFLIKKWFLNTLLDKIYFEGKSDFNGFFVAFSVKLNVKFDKLYLSNWCSKFIIFSTYLYLKNWINSSASINNSNIKSWLIDSCVNKVTKLI